MLKLAPLYVLGAASLAFASASGTASAQVPAPAAGDQANVTAGLPTGPDGVEVFPQGMAPVGIPLGSVVLFPALRVGGSYTDNFFRTESDEKDSWGWSLSPSVLLRSDLPLHEYFAEAKVTFDGQSRSSSDGGWAGTLGAGGRYDLTPQSALSGSASYTVTREERGSPDLPGNAEEPTEVHVFRLAPRYDHQFQRVGLRLFGAYTRMEYEDTDRIGAPPIDSSDRDRNEWSGGVRVSYALNPIASAFAEGGLSRIEYDSLQGGVNRDSSGWESLLGIASELSPTLRGEIAAGVGGRVYDESDLGHTTGLRARGDVVWDLGPLTRLDGGLGVSHEETTLAGSSGSLTAGLNLGLSQQLADGLLGTVDGTYRLRDYEEIGREDHEFGGILGLAYYLNPQVSIDTSYAHFRRYSDGPQAGEEYDENRVRVGVTLRR